MLRLSDTIKGLDPGDWVSVFFKNDADSGIEPQLLVRIKPGKPDTLEIWIDGKKQ